MPSHRVRKKGSQNESFYSPLLRNMNSQKKIAVLYHIFYEDTIYYLAEQLKPVLRFKPVLLFNISADAPDQAAIRKEVLKNFPDALITTSSNQGKDIGGKLLLLNVCIQAEIKPDWILFLHDKKSLQALNAKTWKEDLFNIISSEKIEQIEAIISNDSETGIIAAKKYVIEELQQQGFFTGRNGSIIAELLKEYSIACKSYEYVAGTMFWAKAQALLEFFNRYDSLKIRQLLESGNVLDNFEGTYTHSWERILTWIVTSKGLTIKIV
jgi:lipopolysaccharide biosynthesis protein